MNNFENLFFVASTSQLLLKPCGHKCENDQIIKMAAQGGLERYLSIYLFSVMMCVCGFALRVLSASSLTHEYLVFLTFRPFFDKDTPHKMLELLGSSSICLMFENKRQDVK